MRGRQQPSPGDADSTRSISLDELRQRDFVAARPHREPLRVLNQIGLGHRLRQTTSNMLALLQVVRRTDLCAVISKTMAGTFAAQDDLVMYECDYLRAPFTVSLYWSPRFAGFESHRWMRKHVIQHAMGVDGAMVRVRRG